MAVHNEAAYLAGVVSPGVLVTDSRGRVGITTDWVKKSGINKGTTPVMWQGAGYTVSEWPEELTELDGEVVARKNNLTEKYKEGMAR